MEYDDPSCHYDGVDYLEQDPQVKQHPTHDGTQQDELPFHPPDNYEPGEGFFGAPYSDEEEDNLNDSNTTPRYENI